MQPCSGERAASVQRSALRPWPHGWPPGPGKAQPDRSACVLGAWPQVYMGVCFWGTVTGEVRSDLLGELETWGPVMQVGVVKPHKNSGHQGRG